MNDLMKARISAYALELMERGTEQPKALQTAFQALVGPPARRWGDEGEYLAKHEAQEPKRA